MCQGLHYAKVSHFPIKFLCLVSVAVITWRLSSYISPDVFFCSNIYYEHRVIMPNCLSRKLNDVGLGKFVLFCIKCFAVIPKWSWMSVIINY